MITRHVLRQAFRSGDRTLLASGASLRPMSSLSAFAPIRASTLSEQVPAPARAKVLARWYSSTSPEPNSDSKTASSDDAKETKSDEAATEGDATKKELETKDREIIELKDKYLRSVAEFRNLQERARREQQTAKDFAIQKFARDLIESVDNLDLALSNVPADKLAAPSGAEEDKYKELRELHSGLQMTSTVLLNTLAKHGMERFDPAANGDKFDPNMHEATFQAPQPDKEDGTVFHSVQKGFRLNGRVIRAPKVGVVKNS